ncbi:MAG: hypothetical protein JOZ62_10250, partial [Acidobacteriaceae bacterium]|nr:hypothetical protein [Acidobacteriaceae bacterium]
EVRPDLFSTSVFAVSCDSVSVHLQLDGIANRVVTAEHSSAGPFTIEHHPGNITLAVKIVIRGPARPQLAILSFAMEVGDAPLICWLEAQAAMAKQNCLEGDLEHAEGHLVA